MSKSLQRVQAALEAAGVPAGPINDMADVFADPQVIARGMRIDAARRLGSRVSSFVGLTEVLFAVLFAWWLLGEVPRPIQLLGGLAILAGVVAVRLDDRDDAHPELDAGDVPGPDVVRETREHPAAPVVG